MARLSARHCKRRYRSPAHILSTTYKFKNDGKFPEIVMLFTSFIPFLNPIFYFELKLKLYIT